MSEFTENLGSIVTYSLFKVQDEDENETENESFRLF